MELDTADVLTFELEGGSSLSFSLSDDDGITFDLLTPADISTEVYQGDYEVVPKTYGQTLETANKKMTDDVTVTAIPYFETSNEDGTTVYIANTMA